MHYNSLVFNVRVRLAPQGWSVTMDGLGEQVVIRLDIFPKSPREAASSIVPAEVTISALSILTHSILQLKSIVRGFSSQSNVLFVRLPRRWAFFSLAASSSQRVKLKTWRVLALSRPPDSTEI